MAIVVHVYLALAAVLGVLNPPDSPPGGPSEAFAAAPTVSASLEPSCTEAVPVPTITATVTNHGPAALNASLFHGADEIAALFVPAGATESVSVADTKWEDAYNAFRVVVDGKVIAALGHHFDCLHPILDVDFSGTCPAGPHPGEWVVEVTNSGQQGTHVTVTSDGAIVAEPPVAPGHTAVVLVPVEPGTQPLIEVLHQGEVIAASVAACPAGQGKSPNGGQPGNGAGPGR